MQALRMSARATGRSLWLAPVGFAIAWLGRAAGWPAILFLGAAVVRGAAAGAASGDAVEALEGALQALAAPRTVFIAAGLWLAGLLLRGALRALWLAGALPALGQALAGRSAPAFAEGVAFRFEQMLPTALLGFLLEAAALGSALGALGGAAAVSARLGRSGHGGAALLVALGLTAALAAPLLCGLLADAALCRCALRGEGPARAFAAAALRLGQRPSAFAAAGLAAAGAALVLGGSIELATGAAMQLLAARSPPALLAVPQLAAAALAAMAAALFELWRLGAIAALACSGAAGGGPSSA
jgi:hypothetical protein